MTIDTTAVRNDRLKLISGSLNTIGLGIVGLGLLRPLVNDGLGINRHRDVLDQLLTPPGQDWLAEFLRSNAPGFFADISTWVWWTLAGLAFHVAAHYVLGWLKEKTA